MFNPKLICIACAVSFVLSFLVGLAAGVSIGFVILRALIAAVCFGLLASAVYVVYTKFLDAEIEAAVKPDSDVQPGSTVNITVADENLQDEENAPEFYVVNPGMASRVDAAVAAAGDPAAALKNIFTDEDEPERGGEPKSRAPAEAGTKAASEPKATTSADSKSKPEPKQSSGAEPLAEAPDFQGDFKPAPLASVAAASENPQASEEEADAMDELPDMNSFISGADEAEDMEAAASIPSGSETLMSHTEIDTSDAQVLAQTVRTILSKEK